MLVPVCSRNQSYETINDTPLIKVLLPSFFKTSDSVYNYKFYIGIDDNDMFYINNKEELEKVVPNSTICIVKDCNHKPAQVWNKIFEVAIQDGCDFFFQIGDDVELLTPGWAKTFINTLCTQNYEGVVGPCEPENYNMRMRSANKKIVIENAFVHRKHYEIFKTFFHTSINNWYCDNWITDVYATTKKSKMILDILVKNHTRDARYSIDVCREYDRYLKEGVDVLHEYLCKNRKKIITFSLWGDNPKYTVGAVRNAELALSVYPGWICRFYVGTSVPESIIKTLESFSHVEVIKMPEQGDWTSMFWRFYPASDMDVEVLISRDTDSRLSMREKAAVDQWLTSPKQFHIMRDHPWHGTLILGGMWGCKQGVINNIRERISMFVKTNKYDVDQAFLRCEIYPNIKDVCMVHDEFFNFESTNKFRFPLPRIDYEFVGDVFDKDDKRDENFWKLLV